MLSQVAMSSPAVRFAPTERRAVQPRMSERTLADFAVETGAPRFDSLSKDVDPDKPVFLYLPGIEGSGFSLSRQTEALSSTFNVRWLTLPLSDRTPFDQLVAIVRDELERETSKGGVYLVGESFGGVLALHVAATGKPPPSLRGLVLINPATSVADVRQAGSEPTHLKPHKLETHPSGCCLGLHALANVGPNPTCGSRGRRRCSLSSAHWGRCQMVSPTPRTSPSPLPSSPRSPATRSASSPGRQTRILRHRCGPQRCSHAPPPNCRCSSR